MTIRRWAQDYEAVVGERYMPLESMAVGRWVPESIAVGWCPKGRRRQGVEEEEDTEEAEEAEEGEEAELGDLDDGIRFTS